MTPAIPVTLKMTSACKPSGLACLVLLLAACGGPVSFMAGGALAGPEAPFDASVVPPADTVIALETRPAEPYSVHVNGLVVDGRLFVDPAPERKWHGFLLADDLVRLRIDGGDVVYAARVTPLSDPVLLEKFDAQRDVFEIVAR